MGFLPIAMGIGNIASGIMGRGAQAKADEANMNANAAAIRYSPWTHMQTQMQQAQAPKGSVLGDVAGSVGSIIGQNQKDVAADAANNLTKAKTDWYNNKNDQAMLDEIPESSYGQVKKQIAAMPQQIPGMNMNVQGRQMGMLPQSSWFGAA